ncbi:MAG: hypothetical protein AB8B56_22210 [Crocinitomicaceae bacterium]
MSIDTILQFACTEPIREGARYLTREQAIQRYKDKVNEPENTELAGFLFNLDSMKQFISDIDAYNEGAQEGFKIEGMRIWKTKSYANEGNGEQLLDDLIITPTLADETDLHGTCEGKDVGPEVSTGNLLLILGSARPCPNLCGRGPSFFHELDLSTCSE